MSVLFFQTETDTGSDPPPKPPKSSISLKSLRGVDRWIVDLNYPPTTFDPQNLLKLLFSNLRRFLAFAGLYKHQQEEGTQTQTVGGRVSNRHWLRESIGAKNANMNVSSGVKPSFPAFASPF